MDSMNSTWPQITSPTPPKERTELRRSGKRPSNTFLRSSTFLPEPFLQAARQARDPEPAESPEPVEWVEWVESVEVQTAERAGWEWWWKVGERAERAGWECKKGGGSEPVQTKRAKRRSNFEL